MHEIWVNTLSLFQFERFQGPPDAVPLLCSIRKMFIYYGFGTCANDAFSSKFQAWAGLEAVCGLELLTVGQRIWASLCSSLNRSLRGSWVGLESSKMSDFHVVHNTHFQQKCPWGWTSATFHEKPLENLLWLSREIPNPPDVEARGRTLLAKPLLVLGKELGKQGSELLHLWKGIKMKIWGASSKEKQILILFTCEEIHPALPRLRSGLPGTLFEALSEEITCFI